MLGVGIINDVEIVKTLGTLDVVLVRFCSVRWPLVHGGQRQIMMPQTGTCVPTFSILMVMLFQQSVEPSSQVSLKAVGC